MPTNKQIKSDMWDVYYKIEETGASKAVKYDIIDAMVIREQDANMSDEANW